MALTITWPTESYQGKIYVPKADTTLVDAGPPEIRSFDVNDFRKDVMTAYAGEAGGPSPVPFSHVGEITVSGDTFARFVLFNGPDPYEIEFEDGQYTVKLLGANHNLADCRVANQVSLIIGNSFGLIRAAGVDEASVQAAMDAQGYTTTLAQSTGKAADILGATGKVVEHKDATDVDNGHIKVPADGSELNIPVKKVSDDTYRLNEP